MATFYAKGTCDLKLSKEEARKNEGLSTSLTGVWAPLSFKRFSLVAPLDPDYVVLPLSGLATGAAQMIIKNKSSSELKVHFYNSPSPETETRIPANGIMKINKASAFTETRVSGITAEAEFECFVTGGG